MPDNRKSYNAVLSGLKRAYGLNHKQAQIAWRGLRERLDRTPRKADLKNHPRITKEEVKRAPARERAIRAAKTRAEKKAKAAPPAKPPKKAPPRKAPPGAPPAAPAPPERYVIPPERFREILDEWEDFDRDDWPDDPDESS